MIDYRHMEHEQYDIPTAADATAPPRRDHDADRATSDHDDATQSRHFYTLTVDDVVAELLAYELQRDTRTVQRWCKSGKLRAIIDHEHGDRYLIDPASVRDTIATLLEERDSQSPRHSTPPRLQRDNVEAAPRQAAATSRDYHFTPHSLRDTAPDDATSEPTAEATAPPRRDEVATLERRVAELEKEKAMLSVDKAVREQMVEYLKENFQHMLDQALERTEELGRLQAENSHLRAMLPAGEAAHSASDAQQRQATGQAVPPEPDQPRTTPPASVHRRTPWSPD